MLYPESRSPQLDAGLFRRPTASLHGVPFWSWNCRVTRALHNANDAFRWYGPDAWRTEGDEWMDDYRLLPAGLLSGVELWIQE